MLAAGFLFSMTLAILFSSSGTFACAFKVNCSADDQFAATGSFINNFLFYYEKIGGPWYGVVESTEYPLSFKLGLFFTFLSMSLVHHVGYKLIVTGSFVNKILRQRVGWVDGGSCCKRRRTRQFSSDSAYTLKKAENKSTWSRESTKQITSL